MKPFSDTLQAPRMPLYKRRLPRHDASRSWPRYGRGGVQARFTHIKAYRGRCPIYRSPDLDPEIHSCKTCLTPKNMHGLMSCHQLMWFLKVGHQMRSRRFGIRVFLGHSQTRLTSIFWISAMCQLCAVHDIFVSFLRADSVRINSPRCFLIHFILLQS